MRSVIRTPRPPSNTSPSYIEKGAKHGKLKLELVWERALDSLRMALGMACGVGMSIFSISSQIMVSMLML